MKIIEKILLDIGFTETKKDVSEGLDFHSTSKQYLLKKIKITTFQTRKRFDIYIYDYTTNYKKVIFSGNSVDITNSCIELIIKDIEFVLPKETLPVYRSFRLNNLLNVVG